jgi:hypothetical protein
VPTQGGNINVFKINQLKKHTTKSCGRFGWDLYHRRYIKPDRRLGKRHSVNKFPASRRVSDGYRVYQLCYTCIRTLAHGCDRSQASAVAASSARKREPRGSLFAFDSLLPQRLSIGT